MPRRRGRVDADQWFHVMNRAIGRRTMFESPKDVARFLDRLGQAVDDGLLEVHAFAVLTTHWHALVRGEPDQLSRAMQEVQLDYSRYFNRSRRRDGPLVRGRFRRKPVDSEYYRRTLVGYIDHNAVKARIATSAAEYPFASAFSYRTGSGPEWLNRQWVHAVVRELTGCGIVGAKDYEAAFPRGFSVNMAQLIERRLETRRNFADPTDTLLGNPGRKTLAWVRRKARAADGTAPGIPICTATAIRTAIEDSPVDERDRFTVAAFLMRELAGLTFEETSAELESSPTTVRRHANTARQRILAEPSLATQVASTAHAALRSTYSAVLNPLQTRHPGIPATRDGTMTQGE